MDNIVKIAYFTPLAAVKSGIADFAEELLPYLTKEVEIDIYTADYAKKNNKILEGSIFDIKDYYQKNKEYDLKVFQIGNNIIHKEIMDMFLEVGGIIELHDISLQHLILQVTRNEREKYIEIMEYCHGKAGKKYAELFVQGMVAAAYENHCLEYPVCKFLVDRAQGIIVHSDFAKQMIKGMNCNSRVIHIPLHTFCEADVQKQNYEEARRALAIEDDTFVIGSFGFITKEKRIDKVIEALGHIQMNISLKYKYYIVGQLTDNSLLNPIDNLGYPTQGKVLQVCRGC